MNSMRDDLIAYAVLRTPHNELSAAIKARMGTLRLPHMLLIGKVSTGWKTSSSSKPQQGTDFRLMSS